MENRFAALGRRESLLGRAHECVVLEGLLGDIRRGESRSLVLRGEAGIGKTALLDYLAASASDLRILRAVGVDSEMELAYASLHQLCGPLLDRLESLPSPQRRALETVFGLGAGAPPDRFLVGLGVLGLFSEVGEERPLLCVVDDAQWLDRASALTLAFVARRLLAEPVGIVLAAREPGEALQHLPELEVCGLNDGDARALLTSAVQFKLDERVRDRIVVETHGNPLALLELPRGLRATQLAGGLGLLGAHTLSGRIEQSFTRQLEMLPDDARRLQLIAAAEPLGDPLLLWRAAERLGIAPAAADVAEAEGMLVIDQHVTFRHPLLRSAVYRSAAAEDRRAVHLALAEVTDRDADPDRRAWQMALAAAGPDEEVAVELERSASRAQARGGLTASAAFLERAAALSSDPAGRAARLLAAARSTRNAGALGAAGRLLSAVQTEALDELGQTGAEILRGQIAFDQHHAHDAARLLAVAARRVEQVDAVLARKTYLEALTAAMRVGDQDGPAGMRTVARAARDAPEPAGSPDATDALLDGFALLLTEGYGAAAWSLRRALELVVSQGPATDDRGHWLWFAFGGNATTLAQEMWDASAWHALSARYEEFSRDVGALVQLQFALNMVAWVKVFEGDLTDASVMLDEVRRIAEAIGTPPISYTDIVVAAWRGHEARAAELIEATAAQATEAGLGRVVNFADYARAVLYNGLARHPEARDAARTAFERDLAGHGPFVVPEVAEAAARTGDTELLSSALAWLTERTRVTPTDWSLGLEARLRALMAEDEVADGFFRESIGHMQRTPIRVELARAHLVYGEWLRREGRRKDAREQLRIAERMFTEMGVEAFAARTRSELLATGEKARRRTIETRDDLTAQERQIAGLAREGLSSREIAARLFLSPRTVEWHLRKVFSKLGIHSRRQLATALARSESKLVPG